MSRNHRNQNQQQMDFVSPFVEIFHDLLVMTVEALWELMKLIWRKCTDAYFEREKGVYRNQPLQLKKLKSRKTLDSIDVIGHSVSRNRPFRFSEIDFKRHTAVIGSTGSGKSVCLENLMTYSLLTGKPIIYFDPKPSVEGIKRFKGLCERFSKKAYVVSDVEPLPAAFNPLLEGSANDITNRIMAALEWSESFYKNEAQRVLREAIRQCEREKIAITLENLVEKLSSYHDRKSISGLLSQLISIHHSEYSAILNTSEKNSLTFRKIRTEGTCVYIGISSLGMGSVGMAINKLYFGGLLYHSKEAFNGLIPNFPDPLLCPISVFFDELASIAHEGFVDLQNKCRGAGIEITYATQCPSDLDRISKEMTLQVFENTNNYFIFNQVVPAHTEFFSKLAGTHTTVKKTFATEDGKRSERGSEREVEEFIVHANIFRNLRVGQCVFIQRTPKRVDLVNIKLIKQGGNHVVAPKMTTKGNAF